MKKFWKPILVTLIYAVMQGITGGMMGLLAVMTDPKLAQLAMANDSSAMMQAIPMWWLGVTMIVAGLLTVVVASALKLIDWHSAFRWSRAQARGAWLPLLAAVVAIVAIDMGTTLCDLPNLMGDTFNSMSHDVVGILAICLLGPIIEELCFREVIEGSMLRSGVKPWVAIVVSAALFGLIHFNPVQILFGALMGLVLGVIYYKSGNIVLTCVVHVLNNSYATLMAVTAGDTAAPAWMESTASLAMVGAVCALVAVALFRVYWQRGSVPPDYRPEV